MELTEVYEDLGMSQLGEYNDDQPINGRYNSEFGMYSRECEGCEHFDALETRKPVCCGNCRHWEGSQYYE